MVSGDKNKVEEFVKPLGDKDAMKTVNNITAVVIPFAKRAGDRKRRAKVVTALMRLIKGEEAKREFVMRVLAYDLLQRGRIQAITTMEYKNISPYILADFLFTKTDGDLIIKAAKMFGRDEVMEVVKFVAVNFEREDVVLAKLRSFQCFQPFIVIGSGRWSAYKVREFIVACCRAKEIDPPPEAVPVFMAVGLGPSLDSFLRHEMEMEDFYYVCRDLAGKKEEDWRRAIDFVSGKCPSLASFLSDRAGYGKRDFAEEFVPTCATPFSENLHHLPHHHGYVLENGDDVDSFERRMKKSAVVAIDLHCTTSVDDTDGRIGLFTFAFPEKIYFFIPRLSSRVTLRVKEILRANPIPVIVYKWEKERNLCKNTLGWTPEKLIVAASVASENNVPRTLDSFAVRLVQAPYCRRASNFTDTVVPSSEALVHRAIKACLIYDFVAEFRGFEKRVAKMKKPRSKHSLRDDDADVDSD